MQPVRFGVSGLQAWISTRSELCVFVCSYFWLAMVEFVMIIACYIWSCIFVIYVCSRRVIVLSGYTYRLP